jgi:hypothetical protein
MTPARAPRPTPAFLLTAALLALGVIPLPGGWARVARTTLRSTAMNRADREANAGGYYEGLIGVGTDGGRNDLAVRIQGKPVDWVRFSDIGATRTVPGDPIQFELLPDLKKTLFGQPFTTNSFGLRDRATTLAKPPGTFRIALLGSSMDMGWGVGTDQTYENLLEDWLNTHSAKRGDRRRFEVLNFAVAAYSPLQRYDAFVRKALPFEPDMVIYSATMLDLRLLQIHLCNLFQAHADLSQGLLERVVRDAGLTANDLRLNATGELLAKEAVKAKLQPHLWSVDDAIVGDLATACRSRGIPLVCIMIPRVGEADSPSARADSVVRQAKIARGHGIPVIDLTGTFDTRDPAEIEIAPWDDHPNSAGHKLLFRALAHQLVEDKTLYALLFNEHQPSHSDESGHQQSATPPPAENSHNGGEGSHSSSQSPRNSSATDKEVRSHTLVPASAPLEASP